MHGNPEVTNVASAPTPSMFDAESLRFMSATSTSADERELSDAISAAIVALYATFYGHHRTTATTYLNDKIVVCVLESILTKDEDALIAKGSRGEVIDGRVAFQTDTQDEFTVAVERLTHRRVTAFLSANQTTPGVACELFFLDAAPLTLSGTDGT
jgi:uncharacterized protein YbcI